MSTTTRMGFEGLVYYGAAGSTASTLLENAQDINETITTERGETTVRGDSSGPPINTEDTVARTWQGDFQLLKDSADAAAEAILSAAAAGTPIALRFKDFSAGKGFDGDCIVEASKPKPLKGNQVVTITCYPTRKGGRSPQLYV